MALGQVWGKYNGEILVICAALGASYLLSQWIQDHYYLLEYLFLIVLFGLIHEAWAQFRDDDTIRGFLEIFGLDSRIIMQIVLIWFIGTMVFISIELRNLVESFFGPLSVVQLLAVIVILSRGFVNVHTSNSPAAIFDGYQDTYATYTAGIIAFLVSWRIQDWYPVYTVEHNLISIFLAIILPWILFYCTQYGRSLPKFKSSSSRPR